MRGEQRQFENGYDLWSRRADRKYVNIILQRSLSGSYIRRSPYLGLAVTVPRMRGPYFVVLTMADYGDGAVLHTYSSVLGTGQTPLAPFLGTFLKFSRTDIGLE